MISSETVRIEPLGPSDYPALAGLLAEADARVAFGMTAGNLFEFLIMLRRSRCPRSGWPLTFAVLASDDEVLRDVVVGLCCLVPGADGQAELAYALGASARRRGLMGRALRTLLAEVATCHAVTRITATAEAPNLASRALLCRLGFVEIEMGRYRRDTSSPDAGGTGVGGCGCEA